MTLLSSRPDTVTSTIVVTEDWIIDPPETRVVLCHPWPRSAEMLLVKQAGAPISIYDLAVLISRLGHLMEYEELR